MNLSESFRRRFGFGLLAAVLVGGPRVGAWDERGHAIVVEAAVRRLPKEMPDFVRAPEAMNRLRYLSSEPDRWRNLKLAPMGSLNKPDHYFDVEFLKLYDLTPQSLPAYRYEFIAQMAVYKAQHPDKDYQYDASKDRDHSKEWPGFAPYRICEMFVQLKSSWRTFNTYQKYRDKCAPGELEACRDNIVYLMGIMSHYVADLAQPLHTTKHYDGWVGPNPHGYMARRGTLHKLIDGGVIRAADITSGDLPAGPMLPKLDEKRLFAWVMACMMQTHARMEPTYALEKKGAFDPQSPHFGEGTDFIKQCLGWGGAELAVLWEAAWRDAGIDSFREARLKARP